MPATMNTPSRWIMPSATAAMQAAGGELRSGIGRMRTTDR